MGDTNKIFDALLVLQYQSGNKKAFSLLVKRYHLKMCKHAYWYLHDLDISQDIVQESWGIIYKKMGNLRDANSFGSWAMRIVTRKSLDYLNKAKREWVVLKEIAHDNTEDDAEDHKAPLLLKLRKAIKSLPEDHAQVLRLFYIEDYSIKEIGSILELATGTVKSRLYHAREKLKTIVKQEDHEK